jgi:hypothetical protein
MSRFLASSVIADVLSRLWTAILFILLLPVVLVLSRRPGIDKLAPEGQTWPRSARPSIPKK